MSRCARLRTLSSSATARRYCSQWLLARSSDSASACCSRSVSSGCAAVSESTAVGSAAPLCRSRPDSLAVISRKTSEKSPKPPRPAYARRARAPRDRKSTRLNSSHDQISYAVFCLKKKKTSIYIDGEPQHLAKETTDSDGTEPPTSTLRYSIHS